MVDMFWHMMKKQNKKNIREWIQFRKINKSLFFIYVLLFQDSYNGIPNFLLCYVYLQKKASESISCLFKRREVFLLWSTNCIIGKTGSLGIF